MVQDTGRTISLFAFAGTVSFAMSFGIKKSDNIVIRNKFPSIRGYALALIGAGLCWVYFCTFNTAYAVGYNKTLAFFNTWASLAASTATVFAVTYITIGKLDPFIVIFSSLSGAIAVGCSADIIKNPSAAIFIGILSAIVTCFLYKLLLDSTGLGNLALTNGIIGAIMSAIIINFYNYDGGYPTSNFSVSWGTRSFAQQGGYQILGLVIAICLGISASILNLLLLMATKSSYDELTAI